MGILLGVNIDHIATVRQARGTSYPDPLLAAQLAELAGADKITLHLREDRRHIQERDVLLLKQILTIPMNLEMAVTEEMLAFAEKIKPQHCCLVPEKRAELTTEGGLDVVGNKTKIADACHRLTAAGIDVSLFIDPEETQIDAAVQCQAPAIELHTGQYAEAIHPKEIAETLHKIKNSVNYGVARRLIVNAGHGLHYHNVQAIAAIPHIRELNIGHAIIARALFTGIGEAVREMKGLINNK